MKRPLIWLLMICKRLFKKPGFIAILAALILMTGAAVFLSFSSDENGAVTVAIFTEDPSESASSEVLSSLTEKKSIIRFIYCASEEEARENVRIGKADMAWLFPADLGDRLKAFPHDGKFVMRSVSRENSIYTMLATEKLHTVLYPRLSFSIYEKFLGEKFGETDKAVLEEYYSDSAFGGELVGVEFADSENAVKNESYLLSPLRGLLSLAVSLTAAASVMYFFTDRDRGTFAWIPVKSHIYIQFGCVFIPTLWAGAFVLLALKAGGLFTSLPNEAASMLLYCIDCTVFSVLIGRICGTVLRLGAVIPAIMLAELALSPVFLNIHVLEPVSMLLPPYHYLTAIYSPNAILHMLIYAAIGGVLCILTKKRA